MEWKKNHDCYKFKKVLFETGLLDDCIDATYIIHLEGNGRYPRIEEQLSKYQPSKTVHILFNKGFNKCEKILSDEIPRIDLVDAFMQCFSHAKKKKYDNILILEDDFFFDEKIREPDVCNRISGFVHRLKNTAFTYLLGSIPHVQFPIYPYHNIVFKSTGMHSCIYSKKFRENIMKMGYQEQFTDWDVFNNYLLYKGYFRYQYYTPLCYQLFPETENQKSWFNFGEGKQILISIFKLLNLDKQAHPGYDIFYVLSIIVFLLLISIIVLIFYWLYSAVYFFLFSKKLKYLFE